MNKILNKSKTCFLRRLTPAKTNQYQTYGTDLHHQQQHTCKYSQVSQSFPPTVDLHRESWRSIEGLVRCSANYVPLSPISFLERAADVYRDRTSVIYGSVKHTWDETYTRCLKLASALTQLGISPGDVVSFLLQFIEFFNLICIYFLYIT